MITGSGFFNFGISCIPFTSRLLVYRMNHYRRFQMEGFALIFVQIAPIIFWAAVVVLIVFFVRRSKKKRENKKYD